MTHNYTAAELAECERQAAIGRASRPLSTGGMTSHDLGIPCHDLLPGIVPGSRGKCWTVSLPWGRYFFSYGALVAFAGVPPHYSGENHLAVRLDHKWSATTSRHLHILGCAGFDAVAPRVFADIVGYGGNPEDLLLRR